MPREFIIILSPDHPEAGFLIKPSGIRVVKSNLKPDFVSARVFAVYDLPERRFADPLTPAFLRYGKSIDPSLAAYR